MDAINFKARFITNTTVRKFNSLSGKYDNKVVSLVEMNKESSNDKLALFKISELWNNGTNFVKTILLSLNCPNKNEKNVYILTEQKDNFGKLIPEKILGIEEVKKEGNSYRLDYIQTNPKTKYKAKGRTYKGIGECLLNFVLDKFGKNYKIHLNSVYEAVDFYKKFGFYMMDKTISDPLMTHFPFQDAKAGKNDK